MKDKRIKRGDIYYAELNPVVGSEQGDLRPVLVVQNNAGNSFSPTIIIVPITRKLLKTSLPTHVVIPKSCGLEAESLALVEQIRTIDRSRFSDYIGQIGSKEQDKINDALEICVALDKKRRSKSEQLVLCLCPRCERDFRNSGYALVKKGWQEEKEKCDFCEIRKGLVFGIFAMH